jgi:hypothetical protein
MRMSDDLQSFMGFEDLPDCQKSFGAVGERDFDANRGLNLMYVYCDVATHSIVADTKTPLLCVCDVAGKHGEYVRHTYVQPHYVPVGRHEFDTIEITCSALALSTVLRTTSLSYGNMPFSDTHPTKTP